jgi:hypothetical protein
MQAFSCIYRQLSVGKVVRVGAVVRKLCGAGIACGICAGGYRVRFCSICPWRFALCPVGARLRAGVGQSKRTGSPARCRALWCVPLAPVVCSRLASTLVTQEHSLDARPMKQNATPARGQHPVDERSSCGAGARGSRARKHGTRRNYPSGTDGISRTHTPRRHSL